MEPWLQDIQVDLLCPVPTPRVTYYGAASNGRGRRIAKIVEFLASERYYLAVVKVPRIRNFDERMNLTINSANAAKLEGKIDLDERRTGLPRGRQTWGMSFYFPGPIDWWTAFVTLTSETKMEISVIKTRPFAELATTTAVADMAALLDICLPSASASPTAVAGPAVASSSSTGSGSTEANQEGATPPFPELNLDDMVSEWFA